MFWFIILTSFIGFIFYIYHREKNIALYEQVDIKGGMTKKYSQVIEFWTNNPDTKIIKVTRDEVHIKYTGITSYCFIIIREKFASVEIEWIAALGGHYGTHSKLWRFPHDYPQEIIINEVYDYSVKTIKEVYDFK